MFLFVGNIPPDRRYELRHVLPVMCVPGNPYDLESFLMPLFEELDDLRTGFPCRLWNQTETVAKAHVVHVLADLQANREICRLKRVNGVCPCRICLIKDELSAKSKTYYYPDHCTSTKRNRKGNYVVSRRNLWRPSKLPMQNSDETMATFRDIEYLVDSGTKKEREFIQRDTGIIAKPLIVERLDAIMPYASMPVDLMHLLFENVAPYVLQIWLGELETGGEHAYLSSATVQRKIDAILKDSGTGISDDLRRPRTIREKGSWKADEWRTFVLTTSLVALHQVLPDKVLDGWWTFQQLCELSMRPCLNHVELDKISELAVSFFKYYSDTYYCGRQDRIHLMKYVIHLLLHIGHSTECCGPLVCLSQFSSERYIGVVKQSTNARYRYAESVATKWTFQQSGFMLAIATSTSILLLETRRDSGLSDQRSQGSNIGRYVGFWLRGPVLMTTVERLSDRLGFQVKHLLVRFYESNQGLTRAEASRHIEDNPHISSWDRLFIRRPSEGTMRKYGKFSPENTGGHNLFLRLNSSEMGRQRWISTFSMER